MPNLDVDKFLEDFSTKHARPYSDAVEDLLVATVFGNRPAMADARKKLGDIITETMGVGEVLGAGSMLKDAAAVSADPVSANFAAENVQTLLPRVSFEEALEDMVTRTPRTIRRAADRSAAAISRLYSEGRVVAFARAAEASVTRKATDVITEAVRTGLGEFEAGKLIKAGVDEVRKRTRPWTESYSRLAFRNNVNTAVTAGRFRQAQDPDIKAVLPAFRFDAVGDRDTRHNHDVLDGKIFKVDNLVWNRIAPPIGHNCRCQVVMMNIAQLGRMGRIDERGQVIEDKVPAGGGPDAGFRHAGRPDLFITGAG